MQAGELIAGRFRLDTVVRSGGMGSVYRALDVLTGSTVAVKVLLEHAARNVSRFIREATILTELEHPHIVDALDHGVLPSGDPYLVMEWLDGEDLATRLARAPLTPTETITLGVCVAEALGFAHLRMIVHRDLKPANIFLPGGDVAAAKLLDFGIATRPDVTRLTLTGPLLGTPMYMAPEQARGTEGQDGRADVFALGCVLFECLTGEPAFSGNHAMAVLAKILFEPPATVLDRCPELDEDLRTLLCAMLASDRAGRPANGGVVAEELRRLPARKEGASRPASARGAGPGSITNREQASVAVILVGLGARTPPPSNGAAATGPDWTSAATVAERYRGRFEALLNGSAAVVMASATVASDLASQAARCALALREIVSDLPIALTMARVASTGEHLVSPAIDRAARILCAGTGEQPRASAQVVLDDVTAAFLDARFDVRTGDAGPTLHGERAVGEWTRTLLGKATPCVGRDWELDAMLGAFEVCARDDVAQAILVTGDAGAGKSRLVQELLRRIRARVEPTIWTGSADPLRRGSAFGLLAQALRSACDIRDGDSPQRGRDKLRNHVAGIVAEADRGSVTEFLGEILGTSFPDDGSLPLLAARKDANLMADQTRAAFLALVGAACRQRPLLIVLEDLHWGDQPTLQFISAALRELRDRPLFVLALARPEVDDLFRRSAADQLFQRISLQSLGPKACARLVHHVLGDRIAEVDVARLTALSNGNAFYLEELIRSFAWSGAGELPETVVTMVESRFAALDDESRRLLRGAAVVGEVFWMGAIASLLGLPDDARHLRSRLAALVERELLVRRRESHLLGEEEYAFRHALLREGAYAMLTAEDRALGHRLAGEWLAQRGERDPLVLAEHFERGGESERAGSLYLRAAEQAVWGVDPREAIAHARRGLACQVPGPVRLALLATLCDASKWIPECLSEALPFAEELAAGADPGSGPWALGMYVKFITLMQAGRWEEFVAIVKTLGATEARPEALTPMVIAVSGGVYMLDLVGKLHEANPLMDRLTALFRVADTRDPMAAILWNLITAHRRLYQEEAPWRALGHLRATRAVCLAAGHRRFLVVGQIVTAISQWLLGSFDEAEQGLRDMSLPDEVLGYGSSFRGFALAWLLADRGAFDEAMAAAGRMTSAGRSWRRPLDEGRGHWVTAEILRRTGDLAGADAAIEPARSMLGKVAPIDGPGVLATLAGIRRAQGRPDEAVAVAEEAMARSRAMGACSFYARGAFLRLQHVESLRAAGETERAAAALADATGRLLARSHQIDDLGLRKSFLEVVPENRRTLELANARMT